MPNRETVAVIDVGSNSIKLLVARKGAVPGNIDRIFAETIETRISAGISHELPSLTKQAMQAGCETIAELVHLAQGYHPKEIRIVATSAVRDAINGMDFIAMVNDATGIEIQVLSGTKEATYIGQGLACDPQIAGRNRFIQMDIGGGSLELIRFHHGQIEQALSLQLGAVRLTERFIEDRDIPITAETAALIRAHVQESLHQSAFAFPPTTDSFIVTGGAFTVTRAILAAREDKTIEQRSPVLMRSEITQLKSELMALPLHERMATPHLPATRADIVPTALITIEAVLQRAAREAVTHSFYNLRYGIAAEQLNVANV
jgi:exopolyphosphatase/guanosine-5'-triphosphate,3'-diphosphate pyrophosphatase